MKPLIAIVDYNAGNLRSVQKALELVGARTKITSDATDLATARGVVFPGQGANDPAMRQLKTRSLVDPIKDVIHSGKPFLGVCLGLQLLLESSEEGIVPALGIMQGTVKRLPQGLKVPHIGWNNVSFKRQHPVFEGVPDNSYFYFVHSYYADPESRGMVTGTTTYGVEFCSAAARGSMAAVQFHPEKSGKVGLKIYENFVRIVAES
ncbi:MAG: imidazole glycerol phosphate synthase subunit HisH [SAR202 cluster bacterium]|nr:imidazole glycerol phosphate synthase subunit HisH [SAR202 cluster bacterium]